jgi:hypothetical protein
MKRLELDVFEEVEEFGKREDWALEETAARPAAPQRSKTHRISGFQQVGDMPEPPCSICLS